ncbi:hypothetical protein BC835DRAFT_1389261 [Cytidiella melzeri]|nr:hypothetical protein BC835DRAFT_1389261 [Cytidiella melzeri]
MSYDILVHIAGYLEQDTKRSFVATNAWKALCSLSLANKVCNQAASRVLYQTITVYAEKLAMKEPLPGQFISARLEHNAPLVLNLHITGIPLTFCPPYDVFADVLESAVRSWPNLQSVTFMAAATSYSGVFTKSLAMLPNLTYLRHLELNSGSCSETQSSVLALLGGLERLVIEDPTRAILNVLPDWLSVLRGTFKGLHLKNNCGSVNPGVLKQISPSVSELTSFTLGLSYSIDNNDLFEFLSQMHNLISLELRYYLQQKPLSSQPELRLLKHLKVYYGDIDVSDSNDSILCTWIRNLSLHLKQHQLDNLYEYLSKNHSQTLRTFKLAQLADTTRCVLLEHIEFSRTEFFQMVSSCQNLHTIRVSNVSLVLQLMDYGKSRLRRLRV